MAELALERVGVSYEGVQAVADVSLTIPSGQVLAVLGPSGCGKSTLLRAVAGLEPLETGEIRCEGERVDRVPTHKRGFALMFQDGQLFGHQSVAANVGYALRLRRVPRRQRDERVAELLAMVGLAGFADRFPGTLSGGERQRVALARALATDPRVLLLDEPLSALDASLRERLASDLRSILRDSGTTALMVTHDHEEAFAVADAIAVMREGRLVQTGPLAEVWRQPADAWTALFLGYSRVLESNAARAVVEAAGMDGGSGPVALRRSALVLDERGPLSAIVRSARATPEQVRLLADVAGVGEVDAVAAIGSQVAPGQSVRLRVVADRMAFPTPS